MTNREIAKSFQLLGQIMELHGENPFKIRSYANAYLTLRKLPDSLSEMEAENIRSMKGIGKAISDKIEELLETGKMSTLETYKAKTPPGIVDLLGLKGFGPKKIRQVWKELGIESAGELLYACQENRLVDLKGFGAKSQADLKNLLEYFLRSSGKFLYAHVVSFATELVSKLKAANPTLKILLSGDLARLNPVVNGIEIDTTGEPDMADIDHLELADGQWSYYNIPLKINQLDSSDYILNHMLNTSSEKFALALKQRISSLLSSDFTSEEDLFGAMGAQHILPELREDAEVLHASRDWLDNIVSNEDIRGVIHTHTHYSDGLNSIREMAEHCLSGGYQYLVISDHSKSAFYANGLQEERLLLQWDEIDQVNTEMQDFNLFKSIESDILFDGSLDYEDGILKQFDLVIASVHSNLKMTEEKATERLIKAIENPYTRILGHPTGRLLLSRPGYPIDHKKIIDACAANKVAIELNANPHRLDLDWVWIGYAMEKNVLISINPDAHSTEGISDIRFGVAVARKAGLQKQMCLNSRSLEAFQNWISNGL